MDSVIVSNISLSEALQEYKSDPRKNWFGFLCDVPSDGRKENYLKLLLSDTLEAAHDGAFISQDLEAFLSSPPSSLEELEKVGNALKTVSESPFFHPSLLSLSSLDSFIREMGAYEKEAKKEKRRISIILSSYTESVFSLSKKSLVHVINGSNSKEYKRVKNIYNMAKKGEERLNHSDVVFLSKRLLSIKIDAEEIKKKEREFSFTSPLFDGIDTDWDKYASSLKEYRSAIKVTGDIMTDDCTSLRRVMRRIEDLFHRYKDSLDKIREMFSSPFLSLPYALLEAKASNALSSYSLLPLWVKYREVFNENEDELEEFFSPKEKEKILDKEKIEEVVVEDKEEVVFPFYPNYDIEKRANELGVDSPSSPLFSSLLFDLVDELSPIYERDALRYFYSLFGEEGKNKALDGKGVVYEERNGFWYKKEGEIKFRESSSRRDFSHIAPEELSDGMLTILSHYKEMTKEALYNALGAKCGMKSVLSVRYRELDKVLFSSLRIQVDGDFIRYLEEKE